jgi:hypothetical protein
MIVPKSQYTKAITEEENTKTTKSQKHSSPPTPEGGTPASHPQSSSESQPEQEHRHQYPERVSEFAQ